MAGILPLSAGSARRAPEADERRGAPLGQIVYPSALKPCLLGSGGESEPSIGPDDEEQSIEKRSVAATPALDERPLLEAGALDLVVLAVLVVASSPYRHLIDVSYRCALR